MRVYKYLWRGTETFGIGEMFERAKVWALDAKPMQEEEMVEFQNQMAEQRRLNNFSY